MNQAYIAGPYTHESHAQILENVEAALIAGIKVSAHGYAPIVPHSAGSHRVTWADAMVRCRGIICGMDPARDILVALPNWAESRGAREEVVLAMELGIRVVHWRIYDPGSTGTARQPEPQEEPTKPRGGMRRAGQ